MIGQWADDVLLHSLCKHVEYDLVIQWSLDWIKCFHSRESETIKRRYLVLDVSTNLQYFWSRRSHLYQLNHLLSFFWCWCSFPFDPFGFSTQNNQISRQGLLIKNSSCNSPTKLWLWSFLGLHSFAKQCFGSTFCLLSFLGLHSFLNSDCPGVSYPCKPPFPHCLCNPIYLWLVSF